MDARHWAVATGRDCPVHSRLTEQHAAVCAPEMLLVEEKILLDSMQISTLGQPRENGILNCPSEMILVHNKAAHMPTSNPS